MDTITAQGKGTRKFSKHTFHSLRHSFNSALANAGMTEEVRRKPTGHPTKPMNARYTHLEIATLKNAMTAQPLFKGKCWGAILVLSAGCLVASAATNNPSTD